MKFPFKSILSFVLSQSNNNVIERRLSTIENVNKIRFSSIHHFNSKFLQITNNMNNSTHNFFMRKNPGEESNNKDDNSITPNRNYLFPYIGKFSTGYGLDINVKEYGYTTARLSKLFPDIEFYGTHFDNDTIKKAKRRYTNISFLSMDFENKNLTRENSFQIINVSEYENPLVIFFKAMTSLQEGGLLIFNAKDEYDLLLLLKYIDSNKNLYTKKILNESVSYSVMDKKLMIYK